MTETGVQPDPADEQTAPEEAGRPSLLDWQKRLNASPGCRAIALGDRVKRIGYVFQGNVAQYKSLVTELQNPVVSGPILDVRNPEAHDRLLSEAERLLHNVLMGMSTRVDQQRCFMEEHFQGDPALMNEYRSKVTSMFKDDVEAKFLKGLRNYITHAQLPVAQSRQTFGQGSFEITFTLPAEPLLAWSRWSGELRTWIAGQGDAVVIVDVVDTYARKAGELDKWLFDRITLKYRADIDPYLRECAEFDREVARVFGA
ncbi:hypothetical protein [Streptomyces europaeiscabiei]|uniref:hypothetical protein n=1 Tax=Streptomyces europaeiscabiei TaxID=146819 RepID=UPI0029AF51D9|nr:hypothetical protein [Streptomyces europaeiscabiei]MDX3613057.1 hypothetical protein [Streptomyces europaeiscabiei]